MIAEPTGKTDVEKLNQAVKDLLPLVERTAQMKCKLGIYNHGGWSGEPQNMVAICKVLQEKYHADHVGIVYNLHHGHEHLSNFSQSLDAMKPYLLCLNINGMNDREPKILHLGAGKHDLKLLKTILASGYKGLIGIIGHTSDDVELRLRDNLDGLDWLVNQINGQPASDRPTYRTP